MLFFYAPTTYGQQRVVTCTIDMQSTLVDAGMTVRTPKAPIRTGVEYDLVFSCPKDEFFFVTISYIDQKGIERNYTEKVAFPDDSYVFQEDYIID